MRTRLRGRQLLCPLEPRVGAFVYRNAGKVCLIIQSHLKVKSNTFFKSFIVKVTLEPFLLHLTHHSSLRLQNSPYFCVFKYARVVKQKVWNEAENRERDPYGTLYRFLYWFWEKKRLFCSLLFPSGFPFLALAWIVVVRARWKPAIYYYYYLCSTCVHLCH